MIMKKLFSFLVLITLFSSCKKEITYDGYEINGTAKGVYNGMRAYLKVADSKGKLINRNTAIIMNEKFSFNGKAVNPEMMRLFIDGAKGNVPIIVENGIITIEAYKDSLQASSIIGSKSNEALTTYSKNVKQLSDKRKNLNSERRIAIRNNDSISLESINKRITDLSSEMEKYPFEFMTNNSDNYFSLTLIETLLNKKATDINKLTDAYNSLEKNIKTSNYGKIVFAKTQAVKNENEKLAMLNIGKPAPEFSAPDVNGKTVALSDIIGKVTIIDFWASWCKPCRRENPNVVKVYKKYHDKGLEIISVSLDRNGQKDRWLKAIEDDKMDWYHVSNLQYWNEPVAKLYNVKSIPATFILDENGIIVAKSLRGAALENKIAEMLD